MSGRNLSKSRNPTFSLDPWRHWDPESGWRSHSCCIDAIRIPIFGLHLSFPPAALDLLDYWALGCCYREPPDSLLGDAGMVAGQVPGAGLNQRGIKLGKRVIHTCCVRAKLLPSWLTLCGPTDCSSPGSSVHTILQARIMEWVAMPSSRESFHPGIKPVYQPTLAGGFFTTSAI